MSYANGTQHYNLPQTQGSDKRDWFDTNEAFRNVDTDLYTAKQTAETTASSLETTNENVTGVANRVTAVESSVQTLQGNLATTNENVATNSTAINGLQTTVADNKQDLEDMITAYDEATATASRRYEVGDYFRYNDVLYITTVVITQGSTIVPDVNCESTNVMTRVKLLENGSGPAESVIDDTVTSTSKTWSSSKINTQIGNATAVKTGDTRVSNGKLQYYNGSGWIDLQIGGGNMRVVKTGHGITSGVTPVTITLDETIDVNKYYVDLSGTQSGDKSGNVSGDIKGTLVGGAYINNKTTTSFDIVAFKENTNYSYQVIAFD